MTKSLASLLAAAVVTAACAPVEDETVRRSAASQDSDQCFFASQVNGFSEAPDGEGGRDRLHIRTSPREVWLFETWGPCLELDFAQRIGFDPQFSGTVCPGEPVDLLVPRGLGAREADRCQVQMIRKLTPAEEEAL